jgi:hypothetical protein
VAYPPPPWHLGATLLLGAFLVPVPELPAALRRAAPEGVRPLVLGGRAVVGVAFVRYHPGGVLAYRELLAAVLGRTPRGAPRASIGQIWVDSPASRVGGRELWAIPKELGTVAWAEEAGATRCSLPGTAALVARPGRSLAPVAVQAPLVVAQHRGDRVPLLTFARIVGRPTSLRAAWTFAPEGPLGYLAGRRPAAGIAFGDASITFGVHVYR